MRKGAVVLSQTGVIYAKVGYNARFTTLSHASRTTKGKALLRKILPHLARKLLRQNCNTPGVLNVDFSSERSSEVPEAGRDGSGGSSRGCAAFVRSCEASFGAKLHGHVFGWRRRRQHQLYHRVTLGAPASPRKRRGAFHSGPPGFLRKRPRYQPTSSRIATSSFRTLLTRVLIGYARMSSAGYGAHAARSASVSAGFSTVCLFPCQLAAHQAPANQSTHGFCRFCASGLVALGGRNALQSDGDGADLDRVAIHYARRSADGLFCREGRCARQQHYDSGGYHRSHAAPRSGWRPWCMRYTNKMTPAMARAPVRARPTLSTKR